MVVVRRGLRMATGDYSGRTSRSLLFSSLEILGVASTVMWSIWTIIVHLATSLINRRGNKGWERLRASEFTGVELEDLMAGAWLEEGKKMVRE
uniref:Uncharacterized protein n=1 Tax=Cannabis sativa TaxID=3483 RepID=A0A803NME9_CANSA